MHQDTSKSSPTIPVQLEPEDLELLTLSSELKVVKTLVLEVKELISKKDK
jgi:hypothetical protein